ncbi:MAG TPA: capsule biosynthesis protein, partial [Alteromonas australica]|nr:capsule biosynthesis protein [Alteromonas australica]
MEKSLTQLNALLKKHKTLLLVLPWLSYAFYLIIWAAPQYESHSQLIVKSSDGGSSFDPSSLLATAGMGSTGVTNDSQLVEAYIQSADMIEYLDETIGLRGHYMSDEADMFSG